jgi:ComF family protein
MGLLLEVLSSLVSPERCAACDARVPFRTVFCSPCASTLVARPSTAHRWVAFSYGGALAQAVHRFKYASRADLARPLGDLMRRGIPPRLDRVPDLVVPVPLHFARIVERGFNQAALLARPVARHLGIPLRARALERVRDTPRQATLDRARRATNLNGAFRVREGGLEGKHVLLVDDVRTTGATLEECARTLRDRGVERVTSLVLAEVE